MALSALFTILLAIGSTVLSVALLRPISARLGLVDHPDIRKDHVGAIPLIGGIAIWFAFAMSLLFVGMTPKLAILILSGGLLMLVGALDDAKDLPPRLRFAESMAERIVRLNPRLTVDKVESMLRET